MTTKQEDLARRLAKERYEDEGTIEFDDAPVVSACDEGHGAYVQAWVWVDLPHDEEDRT